MRSLYHRPGRVLAAGRRRTVLLLAATLLALVLTVYVSGAQQAEPPAAPSSAPAGILAATSSSAPAEPASDPSPSQAPPPDVHLTIGYAGDVLPHMPVMDDTPGGQGDISGMIAGEQPWVAGVDLALCGMEVPIAPDGVASGYPMFGTLPPVVQALKGSGWDGCATASNHAYDQGLAGVVATADTLVANGMGFAGTNRSQAEAATPYQLYRLEREGRTVTVAQLSSTYSLNGLVDETGWAVQINSVEWAAAQARAARDAGADVVVLHSQIGEEYTRDPVQSQTDYANAIAATGEIDVLFSAHPHVPQTNELLPGGPGGRGMWVSYSAGNYLSNQSEAQGTVMACIGIFVWVDVTVTAQGQVSVDALHWHPFTVDLDGGHRVLDLAALARGEVPAGTTLSTEEIAYRWQTVTEIMNPQTYSDTVPAPTGPEPTVVPRS